MSKFSTSSDGVNLSSLNLSSQDWRKNKTELQRLSEKDSDRARLPGGGRKKASKEPEINMRGWVISKRARHE